MLTFNIGKKRKMDKNRKIRAMTLSLNPMMQSLILHMYIIFEESSLHSSGENCDTNFTLKTEKWTNKGKNKSKVSDSQCNNSLSMCIPSFNILTLKVPEKTPTQILNVNMLYREKEKWTKNRKIKAMTLSLNPTIQSLILQMYIIFEDSSLHSSGENCDTNVALKDRKKDK